MMALREEVSVLLEAARREKTIGSSLEGGVAISRDSAFEADRAATGFSGPSLADLFIVSESLEEASSSMVSRLVVRILDELCAEEWHHREGDHVRGEERERGASRVRAC